MSVEKSKLLRRDKNYNFFLEDVVVDGDWKSFMNTMVTQNQMKMVSDYY